MRRRYDYDGSYLEEVAQASPGAAFRLMLLPLFSQYRNGATVDLWAGAALASTRDGDCGPCLQLVVNAALEQGANPELLRAALAGDMEQAGETGLGYRFALACIHDQPGLPAVREEVLQAYGAAALASLSIAASTGRAWPVLKRGLGHGQACQAVVIGDRSLALPVEAGYG